MDNPENLGFSILLKGYLAEALTPEDLDIFFILSQKPENSLIIQQHFEDCLSTNPSDLSTRHQSEAAWKKLQTKLGKIHSPIRSLSPVIRWVAASLLLVLTFMAIYLFRKPHIAPDQISSKSETKPPAWLSPDHMGGVLYLSDGDSVVFKSQDSGVIAKQDGIDIIQAGGGIRYAGPSQHAIFNEVRTGRGKLWRVVLPDQTLAWLNAGSSIRYPLQMNQGIRSVEISGEVYFEVAHHDTQPFHVKAGGQVVEDIGTTFNIQSDGKDGRILTTLVEGSVTVKTTSKEVTLRPGEQTIVLPNQNKIILEKSANLEAALAWKNGRFYFQNASLHAVMHQISDWYNVEVVYRGNESRELFNGQIEKSLTLTQVLQGLQQPGVLFTLDSLHRIIVIQH